MVVNKGTIGQAIGILVGGFSAGYFYAGSVPQIIHLRKDVMLQEVRDSYWRKCESEGLTAREGSVTEETWKCPQMKLFLVRKSATIDLETIH